MTDCKTTAVRGHRGTFLDQKYVIRRDSRIRRHIYPDGKGLPRYKRLTFTSNERVQHVDRRNARVYDATRPLRNSARVFQRLIHKLAVSISLLLFLARTNVFSHSLSLSRKFDTLTYSNRIFRFLPKLNQYIALIKIP